MKSLSGADPESKPDYRQQALTELNKLESKVILLNEMLDNVDTASGEKFVAGDVYDVRLTSLLRPWAACLIFPIASWHVALKRASQDSKVDLRRRIA
jgi:hypothetical protein